LLASKRLLATGGLTEQSLASPVVRTALEQCARGPADLTGLPAVGIWASRPRRLVHVGIPVDSPSARVEALLSLTGATRSFAFDGRPRTAARGSGSEAKTLVDIDEGLCQDVRHLNGR